MHCPTCRHDNPATTRFCSACGAVLVESAPDGGRRRVLRPWGMRRTAPPTISPDMPDLADAGIPTRGTRLDPAVRFDFWIVGGLVVALVAVAWINGTARPGRDALHDAGAQVAAGSAAYVSATTPPIVQEARLKAPPLVDVSPAATQRTDGDAARHRRRVVAGTWPGAGPRGDARGRRDPNRRIRRRRRPRRGAGATGRTGPGRRRRRCPIAGSPCGAHLRNAGP